jgi:SAM-dependent methyltransferase
LKPLTDPVGLKQQVIRRLIGQFGWPRGLTGRVVGWTMAHRSSNLERNVWVASLLDVRPTDRVLEIGFGPGVAIAGLAQRITQGQVYGIDHSAVMVRQATRRNRAAVRAGRVSLRQASVDRPPDFGEPLDLILAVNTMGHWPEPDQRLKELRELLRPGGRIALVSQPRSPGADAATTARAAENLIERLTAAGFGEARVETLPLDPPVACVIATRP